MPLLVPLPKSLRDHRDACTHPGLLLDKFVKSFDPSGQETGKWQEAVQKSTAEDVVKRSQQPPVGLDFEHLVQRWQNTLRGMNAVTFRCTTTSPLTLHLSRASALENAGICLHPLYGFAYLPGSGLKGMARAYAETIWLPAQPDPKQAWRQIEDVFGWAPNPDRKEQIKDPKHPAEVRRQDDTDPESPEIKASSGNIVFHDAWPESWPKLIVDIVNNHHPDYYQHDDNNHAPGDWENPVPVYFLAVKPGVTFAFPLAKRRADVADGLLDLARQWLLGALCHLGAGAKTNAGYGAFKHAGDVPPATVSAVAETWKQTTESSKHRAECSTTLELVTPAFLAGANQQAEDCDLRPATLRGLLRWWWRTMHAGYVDVATLRCMEAALWGDTKNGGAIRIEVQPEKKSDPVPYNKQKEANQNKLPKPPNNKTTQGLWYHSYGMHDGGKQRQYVKPGSKWKLIFLVRDAIFVRLDRKGKPIKNTERVIPKDVVLDQAKAALWWLCALGGVGSKARKGFGNFKNPPEFGDDYYGAKFVSKGKLLREACGVSEEGFRTECALSPALRQMVDLGRKVNPNGNGWIEVTPNVSSVWQALDWVGMKAQQFAQAHKHQREKQALGLPRRIGHPAQGQFCPGPGVKDRHASPVHYHFHQQDGKFVLRVAAFPSPRLPNLQASQNFLEELLRYFNNQRFERIQR